MRKYFLLFIILLLNNFVSAAQVEIKDKIKNAVANYLPTHFLNASFMFANETDYLLAGAKGLYSLEGESLTPHQQMPIASGTKSMTAAAILKLQEKGLLNVKDKITKHLDKNSFIWGGDTIPYAASQITLHQLLTHTSGIVEYLPALQIDPTLSHPEINKAIIHFAFSKPLEFTPGTKFKYSNTNYVLLGLIIEQVSGKILANFFQDEIFVPLGMNSTHLASLEEALQIQRSPDSAPYPHRYFVVPNNSLKPEFTPVLVDFFLVPYADGGVISTPRDLITWHRGLHQGKILSKNSYKLMTEKYIEAPSKSGHKTYSGYGIFIADLGDGEELLYHSGSAVAIRSEAGYVPQKNLYFAILSNVMFKMPQGVADKIGSTPPVDANVKLDSSNPVNQLDILFFRDAILNAIK